MIQVKGKTKEYPEYHEILTLIEQGFYEKASLRIRDIRRKVEMPTVREQDRLWHTLSILLSSRIAMKGGHSPDHLESIDLSQIQEPFLAGEVAFVKGLYYFTQNKMEKGADSFYHASQQFELAQKSERQWIAYYNYLIGKSHSPSIDSHWLFTELRFLEAKTQATSQYKILGLVLRQKSYLYKEMGKLVAARVDGLKAVDLLELYGAHSDYQLGLLNLVDINLELENETDATEWFERLLPPFDPRIQFPYHFYSHRLGREPLTLLAINKACPHFHSRYLHWKQKQPEASSNAVSNRVIATTPRGDAWDSTSGQLRINNEDFDFKPNSMESKLIDSLFPGLISKELLCERLWPGYSQLHLLDNRLHRLVSRVNKKLRGRIVCQKGQYSLSLEKS